MARRCDLCGKQTVFGNKVSHSNRKTRRKWKPNLVDLKANIQGEVKKVRVCTKCLKKGNIVKVV